MEKERIIYDSYADRFAETREWLLESESFALEEITDAIVYDAIADDLRFEMEETRENLRNLFAGETLIAVGHCGTWRGNLPAGNVSDDFDDMFDRMACDCDYIKIWDENGHLFVECSHHDGTNRFEIKRLTARGIALYEQWENDWDDKRTRQQIHALLFSYNLFSALPHYFSAEKQDASKATPAA